MRLYILLLPVMLAGCVSVYTTAPTSTPATADCPPYQPAVARTSPSLPLLATPTDDYHEFLEQLTERLAVHVRELHRHIETRELEHETAYREYLAACKTL